MMNLELMRAKIRADNDQDAANARAWMDSLSNAELLTMWLFMQRQFDDPMTEAMSRLAILKFGELFVELKEPKSYMCRCDTCGRLYEEETNIDGGICAYCQGPLRLVTSPNTTKEYPNV